MEGIDLDVMPEAVKISKTAARKELVECFIRRLRDREDVHLPVAHLNSLIEACDHAVMDRDTSLGSVLCSSLKWLGQRLKPSWHVQSSDFEWLSNAVINFLVTRGVRRPVRQDVQVRLDAIGSQIRANMGISQRPIWLLADSMFSLCKPSRDLFPMSYSGQRAEDLRWMLEQMQPRVCISDIVVNHGLNHTRTYGEPEEEMRAVFRWLTHHYPFANIYHLQPPLSPVVSRSPAMRHTIFTFNQMMIQVGFRPIEHPSLGRHLYDREGFHYTKDGMRHVAEYLVKHIRN